MINTDVPLWLIYALSKIGTKELDPGSNPEIEEFLETVGYASPNDDIPWCSALVDWSFLKCGIRGTHSPEARSWNSWGVKLYKPRLGCVTVYWRERPLSWKGHVGFYLYEIGNDIYTLGGNQLNMVNVTPYPKKQLLNYRWPKI